MALRKALGPVEPALNFLARLLELAGDHRRLDRKVDYSWSDRSRLHRRVYVFIELCKTMLTDQVDPDRQLSEGERLRRAEQARRAHFLRLALASSAARRKRRAED